MTGLETAAIKEGVEITKDIAKHLYSSNDKTKAKWLQYKLIYAPLRMLINGLYITIDRTDEFQPFKKRWGKASPYLLKFRFSKFYQKFNEPVINYAYEYGDSFPTQMIADIINANKEYADERLITLLHWVERDDYENKLLERGGIDYLSDYESELREHIYDTYSKLNRRFI